MLKSLLKLKRPVLVLLVLEALDLTMTIWLVRWLDYIQQSWMAVAYGLWATTVFKLCLTIFLAFLLQKIDFKKWVWLFPGFIGAYLAWNITMLVIGFA